VGGSKFLEISIPPIPAIYQKKSAKIERIGVCDTIQMNFSFGGVANKISAFH
jgi:hypothetical protein